MKYIDAEKLRSVLQNTINSMKEKDAKGERYDAFLNGKLSICEELLGCIASLQQEQPMPDSTKLIELWHEDKEMLKEKDFRDDPWRLAYNAFMCGFGRGIAVKKQEQPEVDLENYISNKLRELGADLINHKPYSFNRGLNVGKTNAYDDILNRLNARKEE